jgi:hypothetical protein
MSRENLKNRRGFLKAFGAASTAAVAGCPSRTGGDTRNQEDSGSTRTTERPETNYQLQVSDLEYDLTDLPTSELDQHTRAHVDQNYSEDHGITVLENGEEVNPSQLGRLRLENEEGEPVETTEEGHVPEYAVSDGESLTVRLRVTGETLHDILTVNKDLPDNFLVDAEIVEDGEVLYQTPWSTPYQFDTHTTDRQEFLQTRRRKRNELAEDNVAERVDAERIQNRYEELQSEGLSDRELKRETLREVRKAVQGSPDVQGSPGVDNVLGIEPWNAVAQAINEEYLMDNLDFLPYEEVYIGGIGNPAGPRIEKQGSTTKGTSQGSKIAYVDGDWYHVSSTLDEVAHVENIHEIGMVSGSSSVKGALSVLGEFKREGMETVTERDKIIGLDNVIRAIPTLRDRLSGVEETFNTLPISWSVLGSIRRNRDWDDFMPQIEMAVDHGMRETPDNTERNDPSDITERGTVTIGDQVGELNLLNADGQDLAGKGDKRAFAVDPDFQDAEKIREEYLS